MNTVKKEISRDVPPGLFPFIFIRVEKDGAILAKADRAFFSGAIDGLLCKRDVSKRKKSRPPP